MHIGEGYGRGQGCTIYAKGTLKYSTQVLGFSTSVLFGPIPSKTEDTLMPRCHHSVNLAPLVSIYLKVSCPYYIVMHI